MTFGIDASRANKYERTGVEWYSYFLIQEFKKIIPQDVKVVLYSPTPLREELLPLPKNWEVKILCWPFRFWTLLRFSWEMLWHKPDVLFVPSHIIPFFSPKKTFTTIHDIGFKRYPEGYPWFEQKILDFGVKYAKKKCKKIFTPSQFTKKELMDIFNANKEKIVVTPLSAHTLIVAAAIISVCDVLDKYGIKKPYLFYVGRLEKKKNIINILEAIKNLDITLVLAGKPNFGFDETKHQITNVKYLGWISQKDVSALMADAEIFLFPSLYEGFGIPILEAFACGTPVITSNRASMPEVAENAALLVNPDNSQEITDAINTILQNGELRTKLINAGLERVKKFSWQKCAQQTIDVLFEKGAGSD